MTSRSRAQAHAKHAHFCSCGRVVHGNGAKAAHRAMHARAGDGHHWCGSELWKGLRIPLFQTDEWTRSLDAGADPYAADRCCRCHRPVGPDAMRLMLTRTNDGEWWVVHRDAPVRDDERQLGDPHFVLPIGEECLKAHPEFRLGRVAP